MNLLKYEEKMLYFLYYSLGKRKMNRQLKLYVLKLNAYYFYSNFIKQLVSFYC